MTFRETLYALLKVDAQSITAGALGTFLLKHTEAPYGVYFSFAPVIMMPSLTYFFNVQTGNFPREFAVSFTFNGDVYEAALGRVYTLLHNHPELFAACSDFTILQIRYDWSSPDRYDEDLKCYYRQDRFIVKGIKK